MRAVTAPIYRFPAGIEEVDSLLDSLSHFLGLKCCVLQVNARVQDGHFDSFAALPPIGFEDGFVNLFDVGKPAVHAAA